VERLGDHNRRVSEDARKLPVKKRKQFGCAFWSVAAVISLVFAGVFVGPLGSTPESMKPLEAGYNTQLIALFLHRYAADHHGEYPPGKNSTEVFQALLDGGYNYQLDIFYRPGSPGKTAPTYDQGQKLKPENVCYDITVPVGGNAPPGLPLVFMTGYRITYAPGAAAVPLSDEIRSRNPSMAVCYCNGSFAFFRNAWWWFGMGDYRTPQTPVGSQIAYYVRDDDLVKNGGRLHRDGTITNFIPSTFDAAGVKYQQFTPDGPLPP
jgi:hypothetical protein